MIDALGKSIKGALDPKGFAAVAGAAPGPARVKFGPDPSDTWSVGSYIGEPQWPREKPGDAGSDSLPGPIQNMITDLLPRQGKSAELLEQGKGLAKSGLDMAKTGMATVQSGMSVIQTAQGAMQSAQNVKTTVQAGVAQLASAALPSASSLLNLANSSGALPSLPALPSFTPTKLSFKTPGLLAGEMLS